MFCRNTHGRGFYFRDNRLRMLLPWAFARNIMVGEASAPTISVRSSRSNTNLVVRAKPYGRELNSCETSNNFKKSQCYFQKSLEKHAVP